MPSLPRKASALLRRAARLALPVLLAAAPLGAQKPWKEPKRPTLPAGADTNDASLYLLHGIARLQRAPNEAAAAFHWASRLDPSNPEAPYAQRIAAMLADRDWLVRYMHGEERTWRSDERRRLDSLQRRALMWNPLMPRGHDAALLTAYLQQLGARAARRSGSSDGGSEYAFWLDNYMRADAPYWLRAWYARGEGRIEEALRLYGLAMQRATEGERADLRTERARAWLAAGQVDSALADFRAAIDAKRDEDEKRLVFAYDSKAELEHVVATLLLARGDTTGARDAYGRALVEDLAFWPAHRQLSLLAMARGDTAEAAREMGAAVEVAGNEAALRYSYGLVLVLQGKAEPALVQLMKATELEPLYADPWLLLGRLHESVDMTMEAGDFYRGFLARASQRHPARKDTEGRLAALK